MEKLYINGLELDGFQGGLQLVYQSPLFTDIDNIVSNRTNSVDFPLTARNRQILGFPDLLQSDTTQIGRRLPAEYYKDSTMVFKGIANILSVTASAVKMNFVWGNIDNFQRLFDNNLHDLQTRDASDYVMIGAYTDKEHFFSGIEQGHPSYRVPCMRANEIIDRIAVANNLTINRGTIFDNLVVQCMTIYQDVESKIDNSLHIVRGWVRNHINNNNHIYFTLNPQVPQDKDPQHLWSGSIRYDVSDYNTITLIVKGGMSVEYDKNLYIYNRGLRVLATDEDNSMFVNISEPLGEWQWNAVSDTRVGGILGSDIRITLDVEQYSYITLCLVEAFIYDWDEEVDDVIIKNPNLYLVTDIDEQEDEVPVSGMFPLYRNLPDWSQGDMLKNLMKLRGVFAYVSGENEISFISCDDLIASKDTAIDWSDRVILEGGRVQEITATLDNLARKNECDYAEDDTIENPTRYNGYLLCNNELLEREEELITLDFGATENDLVPLFKQDESSVSAFTFDSGLTPRVYEDIGGSVVSFNNLWWRKLLARYYNGYQSVIRDVRVVKVSILASLIGWQIDLTRPVYIRQLGCYFAVKNITIKDKVADVQLIKI